MMKFAALQKYATRPGMVQGQAHPRMVRRACLAPAAEAAASKAAKVAFQMAKHVEWGEELCLLGDSPDLGVWDAQNAVCMHWHDGDVWTAECDLPAGSHIEYKYIIRKPTGEVVEWQPIPLNLELDVPAADSIKVVDAWDGFSVDAERHSAHIYEATHIHANGAHAPAAEPLVQALAESTAEDVVPAYMDDGEEWGGVGAVDNGPEVNGSLQDVETGRLMGAGANGQVGMVVAAAALGSDEQEEGEAPKAAAKMPTTVDEVKEQLKAAGLPTTGKKQDLFKRLRRALNSDE